MGEQEPAVKTEEKDKPSLKKNFFYNLLLQLLSLIVPLVTTPYLSRILHEEGNGQISYAYSIITIFLMFATFGFNAYGQREIAKCRNDKTQKSKTLWELVFMRIVTTVVSSCVMYAILFTVGFTKSNDLILIFSIILWGNIFNIQYFFSGEEDFRSIAIRAVFVKLVGLAGVFIFVRSENDIWVYALFLSITTVASDLLMWPALVHRVEFVSLKQLEFKKHIVPSLLIFIPTLATTVFSVMDKAEIGWFAQNSDYENGCYEEAYKINNTALLLVTVISPILSPRNAYDYQIGNRDGLNAHLDFAFRYTWLMGAPLIAGFAALSTNLSTWFLGDGYAEVPLLMQIMSVRFVLSGIGETLGSELFISVGKEKYPTIAASAAAVANIILNYFFIIQWGATGAAITTAVSEFLVTTLLVIFAFKEKFLTWKMLFNGAWRYIIAAGPMFVLLFFIQAYFPVNVGYFLLLVLIGSAFYFCFLLVMRDPFLKEAIRKVLAHFKHSTK
jgi:O-antigen/teichoic acid export membrane protein